ncbi:MAG: tRNA dihydrouridine synthase DusB [Defluviitaleaceae bacterium]|nr:tRNA dihydrouridine synthase DusB [Defluviitaleaceae bacterium]
MKIGDIELKSKVVLAPLAGVSDLVFRRICREFGAGLVTTEMVSAKAIMHGNAATQLLLRNDDDDRPTAIQLFGSEPDVMAEAARFLDANFDFEIIDINMGCPAPKIVKNGDGSALMKDPQLAGRIVSAVVAATKKPVTAKIRLGWDCNSINCVEIAKIVEANGVSGITVHGRTRSQMYNGLACWDGIKSVKDAVKVPVTGNGDVSEPEQAKKLMEHSSVDCLMVGRASFGNPWVFKRISHYLATGEILSKPTAKERIDMALHHAKEAIAHDGEKVALREMRKHIAWYIKGIHNATQAKVAVNNAKSFEEVEGILNELRLADCE